MLVSECKKRDRVALKYVIKPWTEYSTAHVLALQSYKYFMVPVSTLHKKTF